MDDRPTDDCRAGDPHTPLAPKPWRQLAEELLRETDHDKILELAQELCDAVDEQVLGRHKLGRPQKEK
jgi:hypothetical protein